jgi:hypothetical protein
VVPYDDTVLPHKELSAEEGTRLAQFDIFLVNRKYSPYLPYPSLLKGGVMMSLKSDI